MNKTVLLTSIIALALGLIAGKLIFGNGVDVQSVSSTDHSAHNKPSTNEDANEATIWTCSMHPQIRQEEPGLCPICEMDLIPLDSGTSSNDPTVLTMTENAARLAQIATVKVGHSTGMAVESEILVDGTVELDERLTKTQTSHLGGRIENLFVTFTGEYVKEGQRIATIYSPELLTASKELITADKFDERIAGVKEAAIRKLKNWKVNDAQIAQILESGRAMETIDIFADHSGYVLKRMANQGDYVRQGGALFTLGQTGNVWLFFNIFESDLAQVKVGQQVRFNTPSLPGRNFTARIAYIDPLLDPVNRTARARAMLNNPSNLLKPGMLLKGQVLSRVAGQAGDPVIVPKSAVLWTGKKSVVYVQLEEESVPSFQYREVTLGRPLGDGYEVMDGLTGGEVVVTNGAFVIDASAQLNNQISMMNKDVNVKKDKTSMIPDYVESTPDAFRNQLDAVVKQYLILKDALVAGVSSETISVQKELSSALETVDMTLVKGDAHLYWMDQMQAIRDHSQRLGQSNDLEAQRKQFDFLSKAMIKVTKAFGTNKETLFVQYCPMAFNNQGAEWISSEDFIRNPYFGDKMLKCGSVLDSIEVAVMNNTAIQ